MLSRTKELCYLTSFVIRLFENAEKVSFSPPIIVVVPCFVSSKGASCVLDTLRGTLRDTPFERPESNSVQGGMGEAVECSCYCNGSPHARASGAYSPYRSLNSMAGCAEGALGLPALGRGRLLGHRKTAPRSTRCQANGLKQILSLGPETLTP